MTRRLDPIYTPPEIAEQVVAAMPADMSGPVLDPAAGEGALLEAAAARFGGRIRALALDIDLAAVAHLSSKPDWIVSKADTLDARARRATRAWREARHSLGAVVINPPFSYRGNGGTVIEYGNFRGRVAPAIEFLSVALADLKPEFGFWAILPEGAVLADKHKAFWTEVRSDYEFRVIASLPQGTFPGARVSTMVIELRPGASGGTMSTVSPVAGASSRGGCICVEVIRGRMPVHRSTVVDGALSDGAARFVHTTDVGVRPSSSKSRQASLTYGDAAPMVLIPRVGRWNPPTVVDVGRIVLSDCLFGIRPIDRTSLSALAESLRDRGRAISARYKGTGAKYLTLASLTTELSELGWRPVIVKASAEPGLCRCGAGPAIAEYGT